MCHSDMSTLNMLLFKYHTFLTRECFQVDLPRTVNLLESVHSMCSCVWCFFSPVYSTEIALLLFLNLRFLFQVLFFSIFILPF